MLAKAEDIMRRSRTSIAIAVCALALQSLPGAAQSLPEHDYQLALGIFLQGSEDATADAREYRAALFDGLDGRYIATMGFGADPRTSGLVEQACERSGVDVSVRDPYSFSMTFYSGREDEFTTIFSSQVGQRFGTFTDPVSLLRRLGLDDGQNEELTVLPLQNVNDTADVWRVGPDVLVINEDKQMPEIYVRCPS
jgi:hypothetical protein